MEIFKGIEILETNVTRQCFHVDELFGTGRVAAAVVVVVVVVVVLVFQFTGAFGVARGRGFDLSRLTFHHQIQSSPTEGQTKAKKSLPI